MLDFTGRIQYEKNYFLKNLRRRVDHENIATSSAWVFFYCSAPTFLLNCFLFFYLKNFHPELVNLSGPKAQSDAFDFFPLVIFNPFFESMIVAALMKLLYKVTGNGSCVLFSALLIAGIHALQNPLWGLTIFPFFLIQSYVFFTLQKVKFKKAFLVIWIAHFFHNLCSWVTVSIDNSF